MKRIILFLATNLAVMLVLSIVLSLLGIAVMWMGLYPQRFNEVIKDALDGGLQHVCIA